MALRAPQHLEDEIDPILRTADQFESTHPRVAHLCRYYAFKETAKLDPTSRGPGVAEFKTALTRSLEGAIDRTATLGSILETNAEVMTDFYRHYNETVIRPLENCTSEADKERLAEAHKTDAILYDVLCMVVLLHEDYLKTMEIRRIEDENTTEMFRAMARKTGESSRRQRRGGSGGH